MARCRSLALALLAPCAALGAQDGAAAPPRIDIPYLTAPITVDGHLDEWTRPPAIVLDSHDQVWSQKHDPAMRWEGPDDLSASFWIAYDSAHLFVAGRVRDDDLVPGRVGGEWHQGDAIELFFDLAEPAPDAEGEFDEDVFQLFLMPFSAERSWGIMEWRQRPPAPSGVSLTGVQAVFQPDADAAGSYSFEALLPFHNFPRVRGRQSVGFSVAIDDHDASRPGRYQYMTWGGEALVDARQRFGQIGFSGLAPLESPPARVASRYGWLWESLRFIALPALLVAGVAALIRGVLLLGRRMRAVRRIGLAGGVVLFGIGLLLPGRAIEHRLDGDRARVQAVVQMLRDEVPRMEGTLLGGYRGSERDRVLVDLLSGGSIAREQEFRYTFHGALGPAGPVLGADVRALPGLGFDVRPYGIPLPVGEREQFGFREPIGRGQLNVVVARPPTAGALSWDPDVTLDPTLDAVVLELIAYGPGGGSTETILEVTGPFVPVADPSLERMEVSYKTLAIDAPLESIAVRCLQGDGIRLVGLTWVSPLDRGPVQVPLFLGADTIAGVPTDVRGPWPRSAGIELRENGGTATFDVPPRPAEGPRKLWLLYHGVYRSRLTEPLGLGSHVCELTIDFAEEGVPPQVVGFQHQQTMFYGHDRANRELPGEGSVRVAQRWEGEDGDVRVDFIREIELPPGATPVALRLRNTGPYSIRFRSAVFGAAVPTVATSPPDSPLVRRDGGGEVLRAELQERLAGVDVAIYRNGRLSATTLPASDQRERVTLPDEARAAVPDDRVVERVVTAGDHVVHESYAVLRGEAWSGAVFAVLLRDRGHGEFVRAMHQAGAVLWLGALPVLLWLFSQALALVSNLRLRLVFVLSVATLVPLLALSWVLVRVIEGDHEARVRERAQQAIAAVDKQLADEKAQLLVNARTWIDDLVAIVEERELLERPDVGLAFEQVLRPTMQSQMPPSWGEFGFLSFEYNPEPGSERHGPVAVYAGGRTLRSIDTQLRSEVGTYLEWSVPLIGVRESRTLAGGGTCALSVGRQLDASFLAGLGRDKSVLLCDARGYPVAVAGSEAVPAITLERHGRRPDLQAEREEILRRLAAGRQSVVRRHDDGDAHWIAGYVPLFDLQNTPRLLLGLVEHDAAATLPLAVGRVPVRAFFGGVAGLLLVFSLFLSLVVSTRISRPIDQLASGAQALGRGQLELQIATDEGGQIGRLTRAFNQMATDLRCRIEDLRSLNRGMQELTSKLDLAETVQSASGFFARHSPADAVRLLIDARDSAVIEVAGEDGDPLPVDAPDVRALLQATGPCCVPLRSGRGALGARFPRHRSALALPLWVAGRSRGVVLLLFESSTPGPADLELLWAMAAQSAAAIENARLYQTAVEDVHTGALRREHFPTRVAQEVARAEHEGLALCLIGARLELGVGGAAGDPRLAEGMVATVRRILPRSASIGRTAELELQVVVPMPRADGEQLAAAIAEALRGFAESVAGGRPPAVAVALAGYPDDAASAEFLFATLQQRLAPGLQHAPPAARDPGAGVVMSSPAMAGVLRTIERVAPTDISVLLLGDTGTGKEVLADLIHRWSKRAAGPLVRVHCAALPESLLASELFGHEKGAFTGAVERKLGRFEQAEGGTIFLDEIGEVSLDVQVKLLRVLQERQIDRVGGSQPVPVDVRVVAATNRDIERMVAEGRFREDLYYRLQGMMIRVPPLRERREEIPALVEMFRRQAVADGHTRVEGFSADAMDELYRRDWPGNVRELKNAVLRAMVLASGPRVSRSDVLGSERPDADPRPHRIDEPGPENGLPGNGAAPSAGAGDRPSVGGPAPGSPTDATPTPADAPEPARGDAAEGRAPSPAPLAPHLDGRLRALRELCRARGTLSSQEYAEHAGVSARTAFRDLPVLTEQGVLVRLGRRRGARYALADSDVNQDPAG